MLFTYPENATQLGFVIKGLGAHSGRTIMLEELRLLFSNCPKESSKEDYQKAVLYDNVLLKQTQSTRHESFSRLRRLYGLSSTFLTFRSLRDLWENDIDAQPILAILSALAREPLLRASTSQILSTPKGIHLSAQEISKGIQEQFPELNETTRASVSRNIISSWTQSGHIKGRVNKIRVQPLIHSSSLVYALFLGHLCGDRGEGLFHTPWAQVLDTPIHILHNLAKTASQYGWLEYRHSGEVTDISFHYLLREGEKPTP